MRTRIRVRFPEDLARPAPLGSPSRSKLDWRSAVCEVQSFPAYVSPETCRRIVALAGRYPGEAGELEEGREGRRNRVRWLPFDEDTAWLTQIVARLFVTANRRYGFDIKGFAEPIHVIEYGLSDHIDWHLDCGARGTSTRKLVATILLSSPRSFTGGDLTFSTTPDDPHRPTIGEATVFPAFLSHRVTPLRSGRRRVLAAWAHGPAFR